MPAIILSDNGVSSGSAGLKTSGSNDGILALQTTTAGGTATTAVTINASQNVGLGVSPGVKLDIGSGTLRIRNATGDSNGLQIYQDTSDTTRIYNFYSGPLTFGTNNTERVRIDASGNFLVGTTSSVSGYTAVIGGSSGGLYIGSTPVATSGALTLLRDTSATGANTTLGSIVFSSSPGTDYYIGKRSESAVGSLTFGNANTGAEYARITSSGNFGVGTTSPIYRLDVAQAGATTIASSFAMARITGANSVANDLTLIGPNTSQVRINFGDTDAANVGEVGYDHSSNSLRFVTNGVQRAVFDGSGNFLIGTTTNIGSARTSIVNASGVTLNLEKATGSSLQFTYAGGTTDAQIAGGGNGALLFYTGNTLSEKARIDSSGNLLVGTTSAWGKFAADIGASSFTASTSGASLTWGTSSTSGRPAITVASTGTGEDAAFRTVVSPNNGSTWLGWTNGINIETGSNTLSWCINGSANPSRVFSSGGVAMRLTTGGALSTTTGSLGTISDIRMKKDVVDATPKLDKLMQLRVVNYVLIDDPEERKLLGFVAQEVEQVFAGLIEEHDILDPDTKEVTMHQKTVKTTVLIPMLVKAIQEQQAIIAQLQADVATLKGTP